MKRRTSHLAAWSAAFLALACSCLGQKPNAALNQKIDVALAQGSAEKLIPLEAKVEALWPNEVGNYFLASDKLGAALDALARTNLAARPEVLKLGMALLGKACPEDLLVRRRCFDVKKMWVGRLAQADYLAPDLETAQLLAKAVSEARAAVPQWETNFHYDITWPRPPIPATNPPQNIVILIRPDDVKDPIARNAWKEAVAKYHNEQRLIIELQYELPGYVNMMKTSFYHYCHTLFTQDPEAKSHRDELGKAAGLTPAETGQLGMDF